MKPLLQPVGRKTNKASTNSQLGGKQTKPLLQPKLEGKQTKPLLQPKLGGKRTKPPLQPSWEKPHTNGTIHRLPGALNSTVFPRRHLEAPEGTGKHREAPGSTGRQREALEGSHQEALGKNEQSLHDRQLGGKQTKSPLTVCWEVSK